MAISLSVPSIMAQLCHNILMQYIDATMVGHIGKDAAAAIGLISTSTWLLWDFARRSPPVSPQVAHHRSKKKYRRSGCGPTGQPYTATFLFSLSSRQQASPYHHFFRRRSEEPAKSRPGHPEYFLIFALSLPAMQLNFLSKQYAEMFRQHACARHHRRTDVSARHHLQFFLIFPTREITLSGLQINIPGFDMGVRGAALGTGLAMLVSTIFLAAYLWHGNSELNLRSINGHWRPRRETVRRAFMLGYPIEGIERIINCSAQITLTIIVAPLGSGGDCSQCICSNRRGIMLYAGIRDRRRRDNHDRPGNRSRGENACTPFRIHHGHYGGGGDECDGTCDVHRSSGNYRHNDSGCGDCESGVMALRIEAWAEPMYAASIVCYGVFIGAGDTFKPCVMNPCQHVGSQNHTRRNPCADDGAQRGLGRHVRGTLLPGHDIF